MSLALAQTPATHHSAPSAPPRPAAVRVQGFTKAFGDQVVLDHLDLEIAQGQFVALLGASGSGKTTLLRTLGGLDSAPAETVITPARRAIVFQEPRLLPWRRAEANVRLGLRTPDAKARADAALEEVGLSHRKTAWPATLSGGEAQRVALARALVREPELLLLDEPFAALDALTRLKMHDLVLDLWRRHTPAVLLVTHDVDEALSLADRVLVLARGQIREAVDVTDPRPRAHGVAFQALRARLLKALGVTAGAERGG